MSFYGRGFIFDSVPSESYGLFISELDANAVNKSMGNNSMELYTQKIYRRATPYFYGASPAPVLSFQMSAFSEDEIDASTFQEIQKWLFSTRTYKKLQIDQIDMQDIYFNCILNNPEIIRVGNLLKGLSWTVVCDSPFALKFPKTTTYTYPSGAPVNQLHQYLNQSDDSGSYLYPTSLIITMNNIGGDISITNLSDSNRVSSFTGLSPNEILTISPLYQTVSSSTGLRRLSNSNKKFLRLIPGLNQLRVVGNVSSISMTNSWVAKKIGG